MALPLQWRQAEPTEWKPAWHDPYHDASEQADSLPTVGVWDHVPIADGEEGDGDEPHSTQEVAGYILLVVVPAKETGTSVSQQGTGMDVAEMGVPGHSGSPTSGCLGYRINNTVGCAIVAAVAQFPALENPHGQNESKNSVERASAFSQTCHHIPVLLCVPSVMRCCSKNWLMGERAVALQRP